ncbi:MAG: cupin domain-containing protein [Firmicutes bacterium]|nr:cupin domain-containing protein [Alicyclobacillaceae bacterium]MCL6496959.1 cupin domain-containing protein [Bacillota bacterium]
MQWAVLEWAGGPTDLAAASEAVAVAEALAQAWGSGRVLRLDWAWQLLAPDGVGDAAVDVPAGNPRLRLRLFSDWFRLTLGQGAQASPAGPRVAVVPRTTPAAREWICRTLSFYADAVGWCRLDAHPMPAQTLAEAYPAFLAGGAGPWEEAWWPPVARPFDPQAPEAGLWARTQKVTPDGIFVYLSAALGSDRLAAQVYRLKPHGRGNRRHSHSDVDECYAILAGSGVLDMGWRTVPVSQGDIVAKPAGGGLAFAFVAGPEGMTVLDVEGWRSFSQSDVVVYPDHAERYLRGPGLEVGVPEAALFPAREILAAYDQRYRRKPDGSRSPAP